MGRALVIRVAASGSGFGLVHSCARIAEKRGATNPREWAERFGFWPEAASDAYRLGRVARGFADRSQFLLSNNDLLWLCGATVPAEIFRLCTLCRECGNMSWP